MKTSAIETAKLKGFYVAILVLISILTAKAQPICDYRIHNTLDCDVVVSVSFSENIPPCSVCPGSPQSITVYANSTYVITCADIAAAWGCSNTLCDMSIQMTSPITSAVCPLNNMVPLTGLPASCNAGSGAQMDVSAADANINR